MTREEFNFIISKTYNYTEGALENFKYYRVLAIRNNYCREKNKPLYAAIPEGPNDETDRKLNWNGNCIKTNEEGDSYIAGLYYTCLYPEELWDKLLPTIYYREFNKDFDDFVKQVLPLFRKISKYYKDIDLEFWQGVFSFGESWVVEGKSLEKSINSKKNGKLYCSTLLEIYPYIKEFLDKHPYAKDTVNCRLAICTGPHQYEGILFDDLENPII